MKYTPEKQASIVSLHRSVLNEVMARETVFRLEFDGNKRRHILPFSHWGREFMQQEEFDIWVMLSEHNISEGEAIGRITDIMEKYYSTAYPLR